MRGSPIEEEERVWIDVRESQKTTVYTGVEVLPVRRMAMRRAGPGDEWSPLPRSQSSVFLPRAAGNTKGSEHDKGRIRFVFQKAWLVHAMLLFSFLFGFGMTWKEDSAKDPVSSLVL